MALSYKTRGNSSPQGKPKVYFACHPDDFHYFNEISDEILHEINCAVFYASEPVTDVEAHLRDLSEMNLIVIPITAKFLTEPSATRDTEFPFSQEKHIPVLPLVQEAGLVDLFNKVLGDIQFLDKNARDDTAISFEEKFKNFLTSILVGDELADKIRNAFDAYIFLSYRKKDRAYAQELMRLIHENEFCRDVAIWYDEFLTPGENFNDTIAEALNKSKLFALAVTPNLVNETNYVMTTEYPMAKKAGKEILAAELVPTDRAVLESHYADLPENIDAHDPESLADALVNALDSIVLRQNDTDPRHNFFIGLAYLSGIDVEKNPARALSLITSAAESGLPEACEKLVTMYKTGEGVKRDYEKAIKWQEKLVGFWKNALLKERSKDNAASYLMAICTLSDCFEALSDYGNAKLLILETLLECEGLNGVLSDTVLDRDRAILCGKLASYCTSMGDQEGAERYYNAMKQHSERLQESTAKEADDIREFSLSWLKETREKKEFAALSDEIWNAIQEIFLSSIEDYRIYARRELAVCYTARGVSLLEEGKLDAASHDFTLALSIMEEIVGRLTDYHEIKGEVVRESARLHCYLGDIDRAEGRLPDALARYTIAHDMLLSIGETDDTAIVLFRMAEIYEALAAYETALALKLRSLDIAKAFAEKTGTVQAYESLAASHASLAYLYRDNLDNKSEARIHALAAQEIIETHLSARHELPPMIEAFYTSVKRLVESLEE